MKKSLFAMMLAVAGVFSLGAAEATASKNGDYESFMITIWEDAPEYQMYTPTYGVKLGLLGSGGAPVYGVEGAVVCAGSKVTSGFKGALGYTTGEKHHGLTLATVNLIDECGCAIGAVNIAKKGGIQFGLLNFMDNGFLPCFPLVNFAIK